MSRTMTINKTYQNKNTVSIVKLFKSISENNIEEGVDKRIYIYSCSIELIKNNILFGYGVGNVQSKLNDCYDENSYIVAEYQSIGSDINSHNYYFNLWLGGGITALLLFMYMLFSNLKIAIEAKSYAYGFFIFIFIVGLLTENILVRMSGVFLFAIHNSLFYSTYMTNAKK